MQRRRFIKQFALGTAFSVFLGKKWEASVLADITPANVGQLRVRLSDYPALLNDFGSVRLGINPIDNPFGPLGPFFPILINHEVGSIYYALETFCQHAGCIVPPFDESVGGIICPCHGSGYGIDGSVRNGPTVTPLRSYPIAFDGVDTLTVEVPNLGYCVNASLVQSAQAPRLRMDFPTFENVEYEVKFRERANDDWAVVPFALSLDDEADQFSLVGLAPPDASAVIFVDRTAVTGFYTIAIRIIDLTG